MVRQLRSIWVFSTLAIAFVLLFSATALLIERQQRQVQQAADAIRTETVSSILQLQRLGRNLEQLRNEGEKLFSARTEADRQQALVLATLVARHQSVQEHPAAAQLATRVAGALEAAQQAIQRNPALLIDHYDRWQPLATQLSLLADDVMTEGAHLMTDDLARLNEAAQHARYQLLVAFAIVGGFTLGFVFLLHSHLLKPLAQIHKALALLDTQKGLPPFTRSRMREIQAVESAIERLQATMVDNEAVRRQLEQQAHHDALTGLPNRRHFFEQARQALLRAQRQQAPVSVGMADLDFFKRVNDSHGHAAGDEVLRQCAQVLQQSLRQTDLLCRFGGEEFAFLLPDSSLADASRLVERFRQALELHAFVVPGAAEPLHLTISIGLAEVREQALEAALNAADRALYAAKAAGRNRVLTSPADGDMRFTHGG